MAEPIKISTSKYTKQGKVDVDGNIWNVVLPGAGTELRFSQASRANKSAAARLELLDKKIDAGTITDQELDKYDEYSKKYEQTEKTISEVIFNIFRDGTKDNSDVKKWVNDTPLGIIILAFEDVKAQANDGNTETADTESGS